MHALSRKRSFVLLAVIAALVAALVVSLQLAPMRSADAASSSADDHINRVLVISIDGLNPDAIRQLGPGGAPALHRLMAEGAFTLNARTEYEQTETLPNHTGMLTGRVITASHGGHGVTFNDTSGTTVHAAAGHYVASAFDVVHDRGGRTMLYASKEKFALYDRTWSYNGARDRVGANNGRDKISRYRFNTDEDALTTGLIGRLTSTRKPRYAFLHLGAPDRFGHPYGFMGPQYMDAVRATDARIGRIMKAVRSRASLRDHLAVIVTADHGGYGPTHVDPTLPTSYTIPFIVWGKGVAAGADLYALSPAYADPGTSRPTYAAARQPIRNSAAANLAMDLLDYPVVPGSQMDTHMDINAFR